jgi:membrane protease YdiL (CAAX protease family)
LLRSIPLHLGVFLLYSLAVSVAAFMLPPAPGIAVAALIVWATIRWYLLPRVGGEVPESGPLRLRGLAPAQLGWTIAAAPVMLIFSWSLGELYVILVPVPPRILDPFDALVFDPARWLVIAVLAIAFAPAIEELFFRGAIQHALERRLGAGGAIAGAALLFAMVHVDTLPWVIPLHFVLGAVFGWAVHLTGSIWAGVILHAVNNCAAFVAMSLESAARRPTVWEAGLDPGILPPVLMLAASTAAGIVVAGQMRRARKDGTAA